MKLTLDKSSDVPIYLQIVDQVLEMIRSGELVSGEKLPTERELKQEYSISVGTAKAAYKKLVQMNKVISVQGSGTYVMRMETELEMAHLRAEIDQALNRAFSAEITEEQIRDILEQESRVSSAERPMCISRGYVPARSFWKRPLRNWPACRL